MSANCDQHPEENLSEQRCHLCTADIVFFSAEQARRHQLEYHSPQFLVRVETSSGTAREITVKQIDGAYRCPACHKPWPTKTSCRRHIQGTSCAKYDPEQILPPVTVPATPHVPTAPLLGTKTAPPVRDHDLAILSACGMLSESDEEKCKVLYIVEALKLRPFAIRSELGLERFALAHKSVLDKLVLGEVAVTATDIPPGSIFYNTRNGEAVMNNTIEVYGRKITVDTHRERFSCKKGVVSKSSLPPSSPKTRYKLVWPLTITDSEGEKLLLGTHSFNALTVFTLADFDQSQSAEGQAASSLFQNVATAVLMQGSDAVLDLESVTTLRSQCSELGGVGKAFDDILKCFSSQKAIPVIGNTALNAELEILAQILSSYICTANKSVVSFVQDSFAM
ncbi:hypothetical protein EC968_002663 [Mortierella alpina]|nr:hypothetical protein EC968_002663 [Mortierella alpina]